MVPRFALQAIGDYQNQWFEVTLDPGQTIELTTGIRNTGQLATDLQIYVANAVNPANGGFSAGTKDDPPIGATLWVDMPTESLDLEPGGEQEVNFTVTVPSDTPPGHYVSAFAVETAESWEIPGTETFRQIIRRTLSIEITVPGEMTSGFELGEPAVTPAGAQWSLDIPITNTGTARIRPQGEFVLTLPDGSTVSTTSVEMGSVYGGNTTNVQVVLPEQLPLGSYLVSLDLIDEATGATASIVDAPVTLAEEQEALVFSVDMASVTPNADPVQYADVAATITNNGQAIPTANVTLVTYRDGETVESYPLAANQALLQGTTEFAQRYIPIDGWQSGTWTFELVISAVSGGTETVLATVEITDDIVVP